MSEVTTTETTATTTKEKKLPSISQAVLDLASKIEEGKMLKLEGSTVIESDGPLWEKLVNTVDVDTAKKFQGELRDIAAAANYVGGNMIVEAMKADPEIKQGTLTFTAGQAEGSRVDTGETVFIRDRKTHIGGREGVAPLTVLASVSRHWDSTKVGEMGAVTAHLKAAAATAFA